MSTTMDASQNTRDRLEAALYALSRGNTDEAREHVQATLDSLPPAPQRATPAKHNG